MPDRRPVTFHHIAPTLVAGLDPAGDAGDPDRPVTVTALALPWSTTVTLNYWGDTVEFLPGSVTVPAELAARVKFLLDHRPHPMGYGVEFRSTAAGLEATFAIPREELVDPDTARAVRQMVNGVRDAVSIGADLVAYTEHQVDPRAGTVHLQVTEAELFEVSSVVLPRFADARIASIAAAARRPAALELGGPNDLPDDPDPDADPDADDPDQEAPVPDQTLTDDPAGDALEARRILHAAGLAAGGPSRPPARFASLGEFILAVAAGEAGDPVYVRTLQAALAGQVTGDTPGLIPEAWLSTVVDLMGAMTPTVQAFSTAPLPATGMTVNLPVVKQYPDAGLQAAELDPIATRKVLIDPVGFPVKTFAGGQDVSLQEILRTDPSYLTVLAQLWVKELGLQLNTWASGQLVAGTTATSPWDDAELNGSFIDASAVVLAATFRLPDVAVMGVDCWKTLGKAKGTDGRPLFPGLSPINPVGSFTLTDLSGNVRGLAYYVDPTMPAKTTVLGVREAFLTMAGPVGTLGSDVPNTLSREVAVYQFAAGGVVDARGLVKMVDATTVAAGAGKK